MDSLEKADYSKRTIEELDELFEIAIREDNPQMVHEIGNAIDKKVLAEKRDSIKKGEDDEFILGWSQYFEKGKTYPDGTIRTWGGNKYKKVGHNKWVLESGSENKKGGLSQYNSLIREGEQLEGTLYKKRTELEKLKADFDKSPNPTKLDQIKERNSLKVKIEKLEKEVGNHELRSEEIKAHSEILWNSLPKNEGSVKTESYKSAMNRGHKLEKGRRPDAEGTIKVHGGIQVKKVGKQWVAVGKGDHNKTGKLDEPGSKPNKPSQKFKPGSTAYYEGKEVKIQRISDDGRIYIKKENHFHDVWVLPADLSKTPPSEKKSKVLEKGVAMPVGTISMQGGVKVRKETDGKWVAVVGDKKDKAGVEPNKSEPKHTGPNPWVERFKKYDLHKYPEPHLTPDQVKIDTSGDIHSHALLTWKDKKGRPQSAYTKEFMNRNAQVKWERIKGITQKDVDSIKSQVKDILSNPNSSEKDKQCACVLGIIAETGLRPGSKEGFKDTGNRGISTLGVDNITISGKKVSLDFKGKSNKQNKTEFENPAIAKYLKELISNDTGKSEFLFGNIDDNKVRDFLHNQMDAPEGLKVKDLRTYTATSIAQKILYSDVLPPPPVAKDEATLKKQIKAKMKDVFERVSSVLNNTPEMAKSSYVHPAVIQAFFSKIGVSADLVKGNFADESIKKVAAVLEPNIEDLKKVTLDEILSESNYPASKENEGIDDSDDEVLDEYLIPDWLNKILFSE